MCISIICFNGECAVKYYTTGLLHFATKHFTMTLGMVSQVPPILQSDKPSKVVTNLYHWIPSQSARTFLKHEFKPPPITRTMYNQIVAELQGNRANEKIIWIGRSSQVMHLGLYIACLLFGWLLFPLLIMFFVHWNVKNRVYVLTTERLRIYSGIINKHIDDVELFRVKDTSYQQPFVYRFFGISNVLLHTSDASWSSGKLPAIHDGVMIREKLRRVVEAAREKKGVKEYDYFGNPGHSTPPVQ